MNCTTPDKCRIRMTGPTVSTCVYYPPVYDGFGRNLNPDGNTTTQAMRCDTCGQEVTAEYKPVYSQSIVKMVLDGERQ